MCLIRILRLFTGPCCTHDPSLSSSLKSGLICDGVIRGEHHENGGSEHGRQQLPSQRVQQFGSCNIWCFWWLGRSSHLKRCLTKNKCSLCRDRDPLAVSHPDRLLASSTSPRTFLCPRGGAASRTGALWENNLSAQNKERLGNLEYLCLGKVSLFEANDVAVLILLLISLLNQLNNLSKGFLCQHQMQICC